MRRIMFGLGLVLALGVAANPVDAQLRFGVHADYIAGGFGDLTNEFEDLVLAVTVGNDTQVHWSTHIIPIENLVATIREVRSYRRLMRWNRSCPPDWANGR